jgi:rfaE bifunctional protein kinase chain/domain
MVSIRLTRAQAQAHIGKFASARVCVLGDSMLDRYFWGDVERISPEAPVPIVRVRRRSARLGGAANVAANLRGVGALASLACVVGDDRAAAEVRDLLTEKGIAADLVMTDDGRETTEKVRIIAQSQQVVRADFETDASMRPACAQSLFDAVQDAAGDFDALVISDYGKGVIQPDLLGALIAAWRSAGKPVLVDPHVGHFPWYKGATMVTPNTKDAASYFGGTVGKAELFESRAFQMREELGFDALLITRGEEGMSLFDSAGHRHIPTVAKEVYDVTGAGDTVVSTLAAALAVGVPLDEAVVLANHAAGEAVKEIGTTAITASAIVTSFT